MASVSTAQAQLGDVADPNTTAEELQLDTDYTPQAKESDHWDLVHGAKFPKTETIEDSATRFDTDLFALSFENPKLGLAGGSACPSEPEKTKGEEDSEFGERVAGCADPDGTKHSRVPILYRYREPEDADASWDPIALPGATEPGYVGGVAWIDDARGEDTKALVVGGTGAYPRRDLGATGQDSFGRSNAIADPTDPAKADEAGDPRAWIYDSTTNSATELDLTALAADEPARAGMRGFTAVDCYEDPLPGYVGEPGSDGKPAPDEPQLELCFAGALGQVWEFLGDEFTGERIDAQGSAAELTQASLLRYRVRDIRFESFRQQPQALAVTAGCCAADVLNQKASVLTYDSQASTPWSATEFSSLLSGTQPRSATAPESLYSIFMSPSYGWNYIASPGGPEEPGERPSAMAFSVFDLQGFSTSRLVSGEMPNNLSREIGWAVGELRSTERDGIGARGLSFWWAPKPSPASSLIVPTVETVASGWEPIDQEKLDESINARYYFLPSYSANAIDMLGTDGWAVGDHGAILRLSAGARRAAAGGATEPEPPQLGSPREQRFAETDAYDGARPPAPESAGAVPALAHETIELDRPRLNPVGPARGGRTDKEQIKQIVMSRDGSEGWAFGAEDGAGVTALHRFDGTRWSRCYPTGIEGIREPDTACEALAALDGYAVGQAKRTLGIVDAERVPLENDSDPTNDDEFEVLALTTTYLGPEAEGKSTSGGTGVHMLARYRDGRWRFERPLDGQEHVRLPRDLALTAPDEGWVLGESNSFVIRGRGADGENTSGEVLFRFDSARWSNCAAEPAVCGDPDFRLPPTSRSPNGDASKGEAVGLALAGERLYLYGNRALGPAGPAALNARAPLIIYRDPGGIWTDGSRAGEDDGGYDPGFSSSEAAEIEIGGVESLSVSERPGGGYEGWAVGAFGGFAHNLTDAYARIPAEFALMRLGPEADSGWRRFRSPGAFDDYMLGSINGSKSYTAGSTGRLNVAYPSALAPDGAFIGQASGNSAPEGGGRLFGFDAARRRFELLDSGPRPQGNGMVQMWGEAHPSGDLTAMAPDGRGGFWATASGYFFHYSDRAREEVFEEVANPLGIRDLILRDIATGPDGSIWAASESNRVFRYDRQLGWQEGRVPGWDPGRIVTRASRAEALAVGPGGEGLLVGEGGRIAKLSPTGVSLDAAAGRSCGLGDAIPCGTSRDLSAVAIAPDGSALATGERLTVLWRPAGGDFRTVSGPSLASTVRIAAISYPTPTTAYLAIDAGLNARSSRIYRGTLAGTSWRWEPEHESSQVLRDIAIDSAGHGYAVGDRGLVLERSADGAWRPIDVPAHQKNLTSVGFALPRGDGVLIGGEGGLILTGRGARFEFAREAAFSATGPVLGFAYLPGTEEGSVDAWAALAPAPESEGGDDRLLRYRSDAARTMKEGGGSGASALPDAPSHTPGELALAAFGKSDCERSESVLCPEMSATTTTNELIAGRIVDELAERRAEGELDLALQSGDAVDSAGLPGSSLGNYNRIGNEFHQASPTRVAGQLKHRRYAELVVNELEDRGVPLLAAIGSQDLTETFACDALGTSSCTTTKPLANAGENYGWREGFAGRMEPWGDGSEALEVDGELQLEPAPGSSDNSVRVEDQSADPDGEGGVPESEASIGGASTHYALDALRDGEPVARIVVVDTSLGSLAASDAQQQPHELGGGQTRFLERMICREGEISAFADQCTREKDQKAIVVSNTPTYSYGPGAVTHTAADASTFEALMLRHRVDLVVSGALGYNGLYYTLAPGVHEPCPAGEYPERPPDGATPSCVGGPSSPLEASGAPDPASVIAEGGLAGAYPTLIASGAGGKFGPGGTEPPDGPAGKWHGYSIARLLPDGDIVIEQRPILDWIGIDAPDRVLPPKSRLALNGYGRSPISTTTEGAGPRAFHYEISNAAITHRYDLLLADPDEPWLPCEESDINCQELHANLTKPSGEAEGTPTLTGEENPCSPYLCLPSRIGVVDDQSGQVRAGDGKYPETFAIAMLSVDEEVATYPLVFKRSPSFVATPALRSGALPNTAGTRPTAPPPPPPPPGLPQIPQVEIPQIPPPPGIPQLTAATPPELQPPAPPAPPPPSQQPSALDLSVAPPGVSISTPTALIQPPTPPVNPAPPGGARREARQRQAAAQKGGAEGDGGEEAQNSRLDSADAPDGPPGSAFTRREVPGPARQDYSFTRLESRDSTSSGLPTVGGLTLAAMIFAAGFSTLRPGARRREPELPAPAFSRNRRR